MTTIINKVKRVAIPSPRYMLAAAIPHTPLTNIPPTYLNIPKNSIWHNDIHHGDYVTAEEKEVFTKFCHDLDIFITDDLVEKWAISHGWYEGVVIFDVLQAMQTGGFIQDGYTYDNGIPNSVNWTDASTLQSAISQGPVKIGIAADQLEAVYHAKEEKSGWFATGFRQDNNEDHCVSLCGYGTIRWLAQQMNFTVPNSVDGTKPGYALFTWDSIGIIDFPSLLAITHEAWLRNPATIVV